MAKYRNEMELLKAMGTPFKLKVCRKCGKVYPSIMNYNYKNRKVCDACELERNLK